MTVDEKQGKREDAPTRDGWVVVGRRGLIEDIDAAGCALLGYAREELIGLHGSELIPDEARPATATTLDRMRLGELTRREGVVVCKDGTILAVDVIAQRIPGERLTLSLKKRS